MVELFVGDITEGIAGSSVKAAFLKCAIDEPGLTPGVERVMRAVAQAHVATGAPITVHTSVHNQGGTTAQRVLAEEGVDLSRVVIGHCGDSADIGYLTGLADGGSLLGMDRFGLDAILPFEQRVDTVAHLCRLRVRRAPGPVPGCLVLHRLVPRRPDGQYAPNWHYEHVVRDVVPALADRGVSPEQITAMLVDNPRRYFEGTGR